MSDNPYERVKGGRLTFKGGALATRSKSIDKKKNKKKKEQEAKHNTDADAAPPEGVDVGDSRSAEGQAGDIYAIDAAKKKKYEELFPVEAKKFHYNPNFKAKSVEEALDDRVKKKADRYCK